MSRDAQTPCQRELAASNRATPHTAHAYDGEVTSRPAIPRAAGAISLAILCAAVVAGALFLGPFLRGGANPSGSPSEPAALVSASSQAYSSPASAPTGTWSPAPATSVVVTPTPSVRPTPTPSGTASPNLPSLNLPSLLGAIGDSYSQAYNTSAQHRYDNPVYSWVVGSARGDGVYSVRERLLALGAKLTVVDAATSGKKMNDAPRQAAEIVAAAAGLRTGQKAARVRGRANDSSRSACLSWSDGGP